MGVSQLSEIVALGFEELIAEGDTREIGKFLAFPTERIIAPQWLREECGIENDKSPDDLDGQQEKYDRLSSKGLRIQVKYRGEEILSTWNKLAALLAKMQTMVLRMGRFAMQ